MQLELFLVVLTLNFGLTNAKGDCSQIHTLISSTDPNTSILIQSIISSHDESLVFWSYTQWAWFKNVIMPKIIDAGDDNTKIYQAIMPYVKAYTKRDFIYCIRLGDWGFIADYFKCIDSNFGESCSESWTDEEIGSGDGEEIGPETHLKSCAARDTLITPPGLTSELVQTFFRNHGSWNPITWIYFEENYLKFIISAIENDAQAKNVTHHLIFTMLKDFLGGELENNDWFTCIEIGNWGTIADYMNCQTIDSPYSCSAHDLHKFDYEYHNPDATKSRPTRIEGSGSGEEPEVDDQNLINEEESYPDDLYSN